MLRHSGCKAVLGAHFTTSRGPLACLGWRPPDALMDSRQSFSCQTLLIVRKLIPRYAAHIDTDLRWPSVQIEKGTADGLSSLPCTHRGYGLFSAPSLPSTLAERGGVGQAGFGRDLFLRALRMGRSHRACSEVRPEGKGGAEILPGEMPSHRERTRFRDLIDSTGPPGSRSEIAAFWPLQWRPTGSRYGQGCGGCGYYPR